MTMLLDALKLHRRPLVLAVWLAGCSAGEDFSRRGTWQPVGANDANLRAMLAEPTHTVRGVAAPTERGQPAILAIRRLELDRRRPLPDSRAAAIGAVVAPDAAAMEPANGR